MAAARSAITAGLALRGILRRLLQESPGGKGGGGDLQPHKTNSLGSGFIIDTSGIVVTNNHVIADADEINVIMNDGSKFKAELVGIDKKTDLAVLKFKPAKPLVAVKFGDSDKLRLGEWVIAIGNPFSLGGTVTAGIVSANNRDISPGPYDSYIQTDAAINRGNSGGPLFNLDGEVIGVNTLIISPSGGSIGIGFAVPSKTVAGVVDQLRQFGETAPRLARRPHPAGHRRDRRKPQHQAGARRAGRRGRRQGPGQARGHRAWRCHRQVRRQGHQGAKGPVAHRCGYGGRQGSRCRRHPQGRGADPEGHARPARGRRQAAAGSGRRRSRREKPVTQKALGLDLATLSKDLRSRYKIKDSVKGVIITSVDSTSDAAEKRLSPGDVIVEVAQEAVEQRRRRQEARRPAQEGRQEIRRCCWSPTPTANCASWR